VHQFLEAGSLLLRLADVLLEPLRHFRVALIALHLALHELDGLLLEGMRVPEPGRIDFEGCI
jgi:hypothetical protein